MIELRGVIEYKDLGHTFVDAVVTIDSTCRQVSHRLGVDIKANRGRIITFLGQFYDVPAGDIIWPDHIELEKGV